MDPLSRTECDLTPRLAIEPLAPPGTSKPGPARVPNIPNYAIQGELGRGGMGVVYKARHLALERIVALKMILAADYAGERARERFEREARAIARLHHPHIVQVYDIGQHDGLPYMALEYCDAGSLSDPHRTKLPPRAIAHIIARLADALHSAHEAGIVHRDLKPANILLHTHSKRADDSKADTTVSDSGSLGLGFIPKVSDFGLVKFLDGTQEQTASGAVLGTPAYMAPEQAKGRTREISPRTDVYGLGAIFYYLLAGRPPFQGESSWDIVQQVIGDLPSDPRSFRADLPASLVLICLKCLRKEPHERYRTAADLAADLGRWQRGEPVQAVQELKPKGVSLVTVFAFLLVATIGAAVGVWAVQRYGAFEWNRRTESGAWVKPLLSHGAARLTVTWGRGSDVPLQPFFAPQRVRAVADQLARCRAVAPDEWTNALHAVALAQLGERTAAKKLALEVSTAALNAMTPTERMAVLRLRLAELPQRERLECADQIVQAVDAYRQTRPGGYLPADMARVLFDEVLEPTLNGVNQQLSDGTGEQPAARVFLAHGHYLAGWYTPTAPDPAAAIVSYTAGLQWAAPSQRAVLHAARGHARLLRWSNGASDEWNALREDASKANKFDDRLPMGLALYGRMRWYEAQATGLPPQRQAELLNWAQNALDDAVRHAGGKTPQPELPRWQVWAAQTAIAFAPLDPPNLVARLEYAQALLGLATEQVSNREEVTRWRGDVLADLVVKHQRLRWHSEALKVLPPGPRRQQIEALAAPARVN
jgi:hypothetical protein